VNVSLQTEVLLNGLVVPWALAFAPDGRVFMTERPGRIRTWRAGDMQAATWLTLPVASRGEAGLLGIALDPDFARTHHVYAAYSYLLNGAVRNRLVRLIDDPGANTGREDKILLDAVPGAETHDGGRVRFGPDGKLYWTMGIDDGRFDFAQDPGTLDGKILRLERDGSIPSDNPFPNSPVWSYGHRNPQGIAWQPCSGRLYETEHGPSANPLSRPPRSLCCRVERNLIERGGKYGWPLVTGDDRRDGTIAPLRISGTSTTWAPSGATFVTRGPWTGSLVFTGLAGTALYRVALDANDPRAITGFETHLKGSFGRLRDVVEGPDGALYILTNNRDGRSRPGPDDDRLIRLVVTQR
jgi:glucose/arabinose dehydrogenase